MGVVSIILFLIFFSGGFFFPLASPPGEEDQRMLMLAPDECFLYASWPGVAEIDEDANPTEKWLAQPSAHNFAVKARLLVVKLLMSSSRMGGESAEPVANRDLEKAVSETLDIFAEASCNEASAVVIRTVEIAPQFNTKLEGVAIVRLGDRKKKFQASLNRWIQEIEDSAEPSGFSISKIGDMNLIRVEIPEDRFQPFGVLNDASFICLFNDLAIVATSEQEIKTAIANMETPAPKWLSQLRQELIVDRVSCTTYVNWTSAVDGLKEEDLRGWALGVSSRDFLLEVKAIGSVVGLDPKIGCVSQTKIWSDGESKNGILNLLGKRSLEREDLRDMSSDGVLSFAGKMNPDGVIELIGSLTQNSTTGEALKNTMDELEEFSGVDIEQQVLQSVGELVRLQVVDLSNSFVPNWRADIEIKEEMTFPDVFRQINERMKKTIESSFDGTVESRTIGTTKFFSFKSRGGQMQLAWGLDDQRLLIGDGSQIGAMASKTPLPKDQQLAEDPAIVALFETGETKGWGKPIGLLRLDIDAILNVFGDSIDSIRRSQFEPLPDSDFRLSDIPSSDVLRRGIAPTVLAVYRVEDGFVIRREQTYPNGPPVSIIGLAFMGALADAMQ